MNVELVLIRINIFAKANVSSCLHVVQTFHCVSDEIGEDVVTGKQSQGCYFYYDNNEKETHVFDLS